MVPRSFRFNEVVGLDCFHVVDGTGVQRHLLSMVCWGTHLHMVEVLDGPPDQQRCLEAFRKTWCRHFGTPQFIITDQGPEFGREFQEYFEERGCLQHRIDSRSPWQNGRTERHGGIWKATYFKAAEMTYPINESDFKELVDQVTESKNRYSNRSGYSPHQRVFLRHV